MAIAVAPAKVPVEPASKEPVVKTPEQEAAEKKSLENFLGMTRGQPVAVTEKPVETEEQKVAREAKEAEAAKATADAAAKEKEGKDKKEKPAAAPAKAVAPAKKIIRRAAGYESLPGDATERMATAADKMTAAAEKLEKAGEAKPAAAAEPIVTLSAEEQREITILSTLKDVFPDKPEYKDIEVRAKKYISELPKFDEQFEKDFSAKWEKTNGTKEFDNEEARDTAFNDARSAAYEKESAKFKAKFNIEPNPDDFDEAKIALRTKPLEKKLGETQKQLNEIAHKERQELVQQAARDKASAAAADIEAQSVKILGDDFKDVVDDKGEIDAKKLAEKIEALPDGDIIQEALAEASDRAKNFAEDVIMFLSGNQGDKSDPVFRFCQMQEGRLASLPPEKTKDGDGKVFAKGSDFAKMSKADQEKHWVLNADTIITLANDEVFLPHAKATIDAEREKTTKRLERRGLKPAAAAPAKAPAKTEEERTAKPKSPASTDPAPASVAAKSGDGDFASRLAMGRV